MKIAVYLGSKPGNDEKYMKNAFRLGGLLAEAGAEIVYGGAKVGTMGALARGAAEAGGTITGVFPRGFKGKAEVAAAGLEVVEKGDGYYDPLVSLFRNMAAAGFTSQDDLGSLIIASDPEELVALLLAE